MIKSKASTRSAVTKVEAPKRFRFDDIVTILVVVAIGIFAVHHFMSAGSDSALAMQARSFMKGDLAAALTSYKNDTGNYPSSVQGIKALVEQPDNAANWHGPYLSAESLKDPWNMSYQYAFPGRHNTVGQYDAWSLGPDKLTATADDVGNW